MSTLRLTAGVGARFRVQSDDSSLEDVVLAYIEEFWEYKKSNNSSLVGSGNLQLKEPCTKREVLAYS